MQFGIGTTDYERTSIRTEDFHCNIRKRHLRCATPRSSRSRSQSHSHSRSSFIPFSFPSLYIHASWCSVWETSRNNSCKSVTAVWAAFYLFFLFSFPIPYGYDLLYSNLSYSLLLPYLILQCLLSINSFFISSMNCKKNITTNQIMSVYFK